MLWAFFGRCFGVGEPLLLDDVQHKLSDGAIVLVRLTEGNSVPAPSFLLRGSHRGWTSFHAAGYVLAPSNGQQELNVVLASPCWDTPKRCSLHDLLARPGVSKVAVAPGTLPSVSSTEVSLIRQFSAQLGNDPKCSQRVQLTSGRGRKVLVARLVGEMLVAAGRFRKKDDTTYVPIAPHANWAMPDMTYLKLDRVASQPSSSSAAQAFVSDFQRRSRAGSEPTAQPRRSGPSSREASRDASIERPQPADVFFTAQELPFKRHSLSGNGRPSSKEQIVPIPGQTSISASCKVENAKPSSAAPTSAFHIIQNSTYSEQIMGSVSSHMLTMVPSSSSQITPKTASLLGSYNSEGAMPYETSAVPRSGRKTP